MLNLQKIDYSKISSKQKEIFNFQKVASLLADYGFNCIKLADDWNGADFLAYHFDGEETLRVQLKGRFTIDKKYLGKGIYMTFPLNGSWYLIDHDELISIVDFNSNWLKSESWITKGSYSSASPSKALIEAIRDFKL